MSLQKSFYTVTTMARINTRRFFRDKTALFFSFLFPLVFLFIFGSLSGNSGNVSFSVAVLNESTQPTATQFGDAIKKSSVFKVDDSIKTLDQAKDKMSKSQLDAAIVLSANFGEIAPGAQYPTGKAEVVYTQNNQQSATALTSVLDGIFKGINGQFIQVATPFTVQSEQLNERSLSAFDYTFAGLLGFSIIGMGIFGPMNVFPELKKMGILRRLSTTPLRVWEYFLSVMAGQLLIGLVAFALMFAAAIYFFKLEVVGNYFELVAFLLLGTITILGIGLALGGWAKNERQAAPLGNLITFPLMFLSGTFFPRFLMPEWLQNISAFLPLTPIIDGIRLIATEGKHFIDILPQLGLIGIWLVVIYAIAFKLFRWE